MPALQQFLPLCLFGSRGAGTQQRVLAVPPLHLAVMEYQATAMVVPLAWKTSRGEAVWLFAVTWRAPTRSGNHSTAGQRR